MTDGSCNKHGQAMRRAGGQSDRQTCVAIAAHLSHPLAQLPADGGHVSGVCGKPLLAVVQSAALRCVLDTEPQAGDGALRHRLHLPEQDRHPQDDCSCSKTTGKMRDEQVGRRETGESAAERRQTSTWTVSECLSLPFQFAASVHI